MLLGAIGSIANLLTGYYLIWLLLVLGWAVALPATWPDSARTGGRSVRVTVASAVLPVVAIIAIVILNLRVIQADIFYKNAQGFYGLGQPQAALPLFQAALERAPNQARYYTGFSQAYLGLAAVQTDPAGLENVLDQAETALKKAQKLNPLYTEYTANLARLQERWARLSPNLVDQQKHYELSDQYYRSALRLSPNNGTLSAEWSQLNQRQGDLYSLLARSATDPSAQQDFYKKAIDTYLAGLSRGQESGLYLGLASAYEATNQYLPAIEQYRQLAVIGGAPGMELWLVYRRMAELYLKLDDPIQARALANEALKVTPVANMAEIESWISTLP
jgi:tetratricopeptide (TPR) repeat protein